jgi:hypothetical protein
MNKRQVIILWVIAIILGLTVAVVKFSQKDTHKETSHRAPGKTLFESFPAANVASIEIQGAADSVILNHTNNQWVVANRDNYPANTIAAHELLRTLEEVKVTRCIEAGPSFAPRFGMDESAKTAEDRGLTATFKDAAGKEIAKVSLGKNIESAGAQDPMGGPTSVGRYVRNHADDSAFYAVSEIFPSVSEEAWRWLNDTFINPEKIQSITLSQKDSDQAAWSVSRESEEAVFKLDGAVGDEVLNATIEGPFKSLFSYVRFDDVVPAAKVAERAAEGKQTATLKTFEGFTYTIKITPVKNNAEQKLMTVDVAAELPKERKKEADEKPEDAKAKDEAFTKRLSTLTTALETTKSFAGRTYVVSQTTVAPLLKERAELITKATQAPQSATSPVMGVPFAP